MSVDISTFTLLITAFEMEFNSFPKWFSGCVIAVTESPEKSEPTVKKTS